MLINPSNFYEEEIKGRGVITIQKTSKKLIKQISQIKYEIEKNYASEKKCEVPNPISKIKLCRDNLKVACEELEKLNAKLDLPKRMINGIEFNNKLNLIKYIQFQYNPLLSEPYIVNANIGSQIINFELLKGCDFITEYTKYKEEFFKQLQELYIGEWKKTYNPYNYVDTAMDGLHWKLSITFEDNTKKQFYGNNAYPYNFKEFFNIISNEEYFY